MKNIISTILKIAAISVVFITVAYAVVAYWDNITQLLGQAKVKLSEKTSRFHSEDDYDDFADLVE